MALPSVPCIFALYCLVCLEFSGSEDAISRASLRTLPAPPWALILLGIRCFATMPHGAPQGFSMVLAGPSRHLGHCLLCLVYLPCILLCMPCNQRFRRCYFASISAHASGTVWGWILLGIRNHAPQFSTVPLWYWPVHPDIYGFAFYALYALYCLLFSSSEDAISRASLRTLLAPPWAWILLGIRCFTRARILLGFRCFACVPHRALCGPMVACFVFRGFYLYYYVCSYCGHLYFSLEGCKGDLSAPCGRLANGPFLAVLGSDLGGV